MLLENVVQIQYLKIKKNLKNNLKNMINVLQNIKNVLTIIKNLHKEKNVKIKNVVFIKKKFNKCYHPKKIKNKRTIYKYFILYKKTTNIK
jgi:hypothetical protein